MSSYANFYLRMNDSFAPIGCYSRNSEIYKAVDDFCFYGQIRAFTIEKLNEIINNLESKINNIRKQDKIDEQHCQMIMQAANNSIEAKMEAIYNIESNREERNEYVEELEFAADTFRVFLNMIDDFKYSSLNQNFSNDSNHYIYVGIEACGDLGSIQE